MQDFDDELREIKREIVEFNAAKLERKQEREDHLLIKQAVEGLKNRNDEQKRERDEKSRRIWSFGPNIAGAVVTALLSIFISVATILIVSYFSRSHP